MTNATKYSAPRYVLGTLNNFLFTALPTFRSGMEACDYVKTANMNGTVLVYEERDVSRFGIVYGIDRRVVATAQNGANRR